MAKFVKNVGWVERSDTHRRTLRDVTRMAGIASLNPPYKKGRPQGRP